MLFHNLPSGFLLKKTVTEFLLDPLFFSLTLIFLGLILISFTKKQRFGKTFVWLGALIIAFLSFIDVSAFLNRPLENTYPIYTKSAEKIDYVIVLSGGADEKCGVPMNTRGNYSTLSRLMEGVRVYRLNPGSKMVLTGGPPENPASEVEKKFLVGIGISASDIITDHNSLDTGEEAKNVKEIIGNAPCVLVTSASHLPRAMMLFETQGLHPIPAPTDFQETEQKMPIIEKFPDATHLVASNRAVHEYIGILWYYLRGQIK